MTKNFSFILPSGTYYLIDPTYVIKDWNDVADATGEFTSEREHYFEGSGFVYCGIHTAHGNGAYIDSHGNEYPVDSGIIGAVSVQLVREQGTMSEADDAGHQITFSADVECGYEDGVIYFGNVRIDTISSQEFSDAESSYEKDWSDPETAYEADWDESDNGW